MKKYKPGGLVGRQGELDKNKDGKISGADFKMMGHGGKMDYMGHGGKMEYEIVALQEEASKKAGKPMRYDAAFSKQQGKNMFVKAKHGAKMPEYAHGGMMQGQGGDVNALLEMLASYDQNAPIGEFLQALMQMGGMGEGMAAGGGAMAGGSAMRNLPPRDVESLLMELSQQGR